MTEKTIIRQLFFGELHPWERFVPSDSDLRKASNRVGKLVEEWKEHLSPEDTERLEAIVDTLYQYSSILEADRMILGRCAENADETQDERKKVMCSLHDI